VAVKRGKAYSAVLEKIDRSKLYSPLEAIRLIRENRAAKFDETVDVAIKLGVDPRKADQQVRGTVFLPHGTGRKIRVAVFAQGEKVKEAESAGADLVGGQELVDEVAKGKTDFDVAIATPDMMSFVGKLGKILGPRGLMPNPKSGTVTFEVGKAVRDAKAGKLEYRGDKTGIVHLVIGKASFEERALAENYVAVLEEIIRAKPPAVRGRYIRSIVLSSTMGPGIKVDPAKTRDTIEEISGQ